MTNALKRFYLVLGGTLAAIGCGGATAGDDSRANAGGIRSTGGTTDTASSGLAGDALGGTSNIGSLSSSGNMSIGGASSKGGSSAAAGSPMGGVTSTGGTKAAAGSGSTGGVVTTGTASTAGGINGTAGNVTTGGSVSDAGATGGVTSTGADAGSGCTGSDENIQIGGAGLCVAKMVRVRGPENDAGTEDYRIDATEVTQGQYDQWVATSPALPSSTDTNCGWKSNGSYAEPGKYNGGDADHHPICEVDWCDAYAYCAGVGKRLCGAIGGGSNSYTVSSDANLGQWYRACSAAGIYTYPYGNTYESRYCNTQDYGAGGTTTVASLPNCVTSTPGYAGVYDLSGNVFEWEDACEGTGRSGNCRVRGGAFEYLLNDDSRSNACGTEGDYSPGGTARDLASIVIGIRCCSDEP